jgi:hypothetical protein
MSRIGAIRSAVESIVSGVYTAASETVTISSDPKSFETVPKNQLPHAIILFVEDEPERLAFKQQRRRVTGQINLAAWNIARETMDLRIEAIRDALFASVTLGSLVTDVVAESGVTISNPEDSIVYGTLDISTEEVF